MPSWTPLAILIFIVVGVIVLGVAMFTELGKKRNTGKMKSTKVQHKTRKK